MPTNPRKTYYHEDGEYIRNIGRLGFRRAILDDVHVVHAGDSIADTPKSDKRTLITKELRIQARRDAVKRALLVLPFVGRAWIGYVAHDHIIGISKLTRLVRVLTRRFGVQERMTHDIADSLEAMVNAHGTAVLLEARHLCTQMRGVREHQPLTRTTAYRGTYVAERSLRSEFFDVIRMGAASAA